ncbi:MAG: hypothetical protein ACKVZ0_17825 [Gemmatimonadales bacterium]
MRLRTTMALVGLAALAACGKNDGTGGAGQDSAQRDLSLSPVDSTAILNDVPAESTATPAPVPEPTPPAPPAAKPRPVASKPSPPPPSTPPASAPAPAPASVPAAVPAPVPAAPPSLAAGAAVSLTATAEFSTKTHKVGQTVTATVPSDIKDDNGKVVIPAGSTMTLSIVQFARSENKDDSGKVVLAATSVSIDGKSYDISGTSTDVDRQLKGRGVQAGDAAKVGAGAAAGAVLGRVLGGKKKGAVVGGVVGAAAGTAVAVNSADRDLIIPAGAKIVIALKALFTRTG